MKNLKRFCYLVRATNQTGGFSRHCALLYAVKDGVYLIDTAYYYPPVASHALHYIKGTPKERDDGGLECGDWIFENADDVDDMEENQMQWIVDIDYDTDGEWERVKRYIPELEWQDILC